MRLSSAIGAVIVGVCMVVNAWAGELQVCAAASLTDALTELGGAFERETGERVSFNFAGSNILALQIQEGAPADVFIPADDATMDALEQRGLMLKDTRRRLLSNRLVIVVAADRALAWRSIEALADPRIERIAIAEPQRVPAGRYATAYLQRVGLWPRVADRVIPTENVRAALAAVASGDADAGLVYATDASRSQQVRVAWEAPDGDGPPISYPASVVAASERIEAAQRFLAYLASDQAGVVFRRYGFLTPE